ncbi:hypothetical protein GCM10009545_15410 [Saccharopolyspora thermophila]|uniref:Uncharacterized protein n=1 Tax=Saccharopolyspora thermophila TaxID=89367 RepID=A0ABN1C8T7_9PSEU
MPFLSCSVVVRGAQATPARAHQMYADRVYAGLPARPHPRDFRTFPAAPQIRPDRAMRTGVRLWNMES